jgi:two-component system, cell cycle sensor histidine kinase and response regulator CckA
MTAGSGRRGVEILLVEDSPTDRLIAVEALQQASIINTLHVVENGVEAMAYLRRQGKYASVRRPDLILLDLNLPKKDGRSVLVEIKSDPLLKLIPVIVLTTSSADEDVARAYSDHANSYITKPVDFPRFIRALDAIGTYWFEVVTLPPELAVQRTAQNERPQSARPLAPDQPKLDVTLLAADQRLTHLVREGLTDSASVRIELAVLSHPEELYERAAQLSSDVLLVDLALADGLEVIRRARVVAPDVALLVLVDSGDDGELAVREGAEDYLVKDELGRASLLRAMRYATRQRRLRQQLRRAQRMEAIGQVSSGVAHDFNNLLTVLQGHAELLEEVDGDARVQESVRGIKDACERATHLTRQLLTFSQRQAARLEPVALNRVVTDLSKMMRRVLGTEILLVLRLGAEGPTALSDLGMIEQILLNLALHARAAMPSGGQLTLETGTLASGAVTSGPSTAGAFATLTLRHTGSVITPDLDPSRERSSRERLAVEQPGSGAGLAVVCDIVQRHGGSVQVDSAADRGTSIQVLLPEAPRARPDPAAHGNATPTRGTETILLVEDESPVRQMVKTILGRQGYQVLEARSGADALTTFEEAAGRVDLLLTDMVMPGGMTGRELAEQLRQRDPSLRVVYTSGYGRDQIAPDLALTEGRDFIAKPYLSSRLLAVVRSALESRSPPVK